MTTNCKYCNEGEDKQNRPGLICENCMCFVHLTCLQRPGTPGDFVCDVFFDFICEDCSPNKNEVFNRNKFPWVNVIYLTLSHLSIQSYGISNHGYFHYKTHICTFIDRNWQFIFGPNTKQKKNWVGTIAGVLSVHNKLFFKSGSTVLNETGWWKLQHNFSPAVAAHIIQEVAREKPKVKPRNQLTFDKYLFLSKIIEMGYKDLIIEDVEPDPMLVSIPCKKRRVDSDDFSGVSNSSYYEPFDSDSRHEMGDESAYEETTNITEKDEIYSDMDFKGFDITTSNASLPIPHSDSSSMTSMQHSTLYYDSDSPSDLEQEKKQEVRTTKVEEQPVRRESLFSSLPNSVGMPWLDKPSEVKQDIVEMSQYEEVQLLKQVESLVPKVRSLAKKAYLRRLHAKLAVRRIKRHKHLPFFDFDKTVKLLGGYVTDEPKVMNSSERVLDRFQRSYLMDSLCGTIASTEYGTLLLSHIEPVAFRSPYSGATLKPYIRRDVESTPTWLALTDELLRKTNRHIEGYEPPARAAIDYSYVRPQHIAAVNNLCAQTFWPGIDVTEALQYPEFSCVVTYKRLVVGCAFLVPDVEYNTAYISFILTKPGWRNAQIATFMLYHLLQTCSGQDVTLHVSPTNPAIFLYQKFGFKVEEMIQDFYEKYYDLEYKGCRHALLLRLVR